VKLQNPREQCQVNDFAFVEKLLAEFIVAVSDKKSQNIHAFCKYIILNP
jgi:hypothetical protein